LSGRSPVTPKRIAARTRDQVLRTRILLGAGLLLAVVFGVLVYGWIQINVVQPPQPVAVVNGQEISTGEFRGRVKLVQYNLQNQYATLRQLLTLVGDDAQARSTYQTQLNNIAQQLASPLFVGSSVLDGLIEERLIEQEAARRGVSVTDPEIDRTIEENFGFSESTDTVTAVPTALQPSPEPSASVGPSQAPEVTQSASPGPVLEATLPTGSQLEATAAPSPTPYTRELFERNYQAFLLELRSFGVQEPSVRAEIRAQLYRERLSESFEAEVPRVQEQVWARHILVEEEATASNLFEQLAEGADWSALAAEHSTDESNKDQGGDLGWFARGQMVEPFEQAAFAGEVGEIVGPVQTDFGWHLIEILGHEDRELGDSGFRTAVARAFDEWLQSARDAAEITILDYWQARVPSSPILPPVSG
jgi:parvulin-like peptidyl-prolyl isomerase